MIDHLPAVNATLNATATVLLLWGLRMIKQGREQAHKNAMLAAFGVSILFLACYLTYHVSKTWQTKFGGPEPIKTFYIVMLISHVVLAATVPILAGVTLVLGLRDRRLAHRRWAKWTFPIWLYVSVTGVLIYFMLYHLYPPTKIDDTMKPSAAARWPAPRERIAA